MPLDAATKKSIMTEYATDQDATGPPESQVALLTPRLTDLPAPRHNGIANGAVTNCID